MKTGTIGAASVAILLNLVINIGVKLAAVGVEFLVERSRRNKIINAFIFQEEKKPKELVTASAETIQPSSAQPTTENEGEQQEDKVTDKGKENAKEDTKEDKAYSEATKDSHELFAECIGAVNGALSAIATAATLLFQKISYSTVGEFTGSGILSAVSELLAAIIWMFLYEQIYKKQMIIAREKLTLGDYLLSFIYFAGISQLYLIPVFWPAGYWF